MDHEITNAVTVHYDLGPDFVGQKHRILFTINLDVHPHESFKCMVYIYNWFVENNIDFQIVRHSNYDLVVYTPDTEAVVMLKLMFKTRLRVTDPPF